VETIESPPHKFKLPFPSSGELATQAAADLTHALLNPKPAGPFCQVGDEQAIALRKLANIFVSAKPKHANTKLAPQDEIENSAPQRVQTKISPPRVASQAPRQTSLQHIITSQPTPNSHRRQQTPRRRVVTPHTPHGMVRRSAKQQNLSQDMMAETLSQVNHCFFYYSPNQIHSPTKQKNRHYNFTGNGKCSNLPRNWQISQAPRTHHKIEAQHKMDEIHGERDQQII
jgi:hypothetical protein